jgi:hypothetical protein
MNDMPQNTGAKARFRAPKLEIYGRARDITQAVGTTGNMDGGGSTSNNKTQP